MKNKKIFSISMVKNEMDVIESFVRYNLNILDGMIILDNGSTDNTLKILRLLENEGLPLFIFEDENVEFDKFLKMNKLLLKAVNQFNADIIVPLDADEFVISSNNENPRKIVEHLKYPNYYLIKWKTYVPDFSKKYEEFIPSQITLSRDETLEEFYKVILPKELVKNFDVKLTLGQHEITYDQKYDSKINPINNSNLRIAHFPIRSKEQTFSKILVGWINSLSQPQRGGAGFHWKIILDKIKDNEITDYDITNFAKEFALMEKVTEIKIAEDPINLSFCNNISIKYGHQKINPIANLAYGCEDLAKSYRNFKKKAVINKKEYETQIENLKNEKLFTEKLLNSKINEYNYSTSWRITSPLRKISNIIKMLLN